MNNETFTSHINNQPYTKQHSDADHHPDADHRSHTKRHNHSNTKRDEEHAHSRPLESSVKSPRKSPPQKSPLGKHFHLKDATIPNIRIAFFLNAGFALIEFAGAIFTNSVSIAADAIHDLGDSLGLALAWALAYFANNMKTPLFTYGFHRLSLLGALVNTVVLFIGSIGALFFAIPRLWNPQPTDATGMLGLAVLGIIVNGYVVYRTSAGKSLNEQTVSLHLWEDVLGWAAVAITGVVMYFTNLAILDPILSILIVIFILRRAVKSLKATILLFLQAAPNDVNTVEIEKILTEHSLVQEVHDIHVWSLDGEKHILSAHIVVGKKTAKNVIISLKAELMERLKNLGIGHSTLEIEFEDEKCFDTC